MTLTYDSISIHAPREGSDDVLCGLKAGSRISIHAPREGSDLGIEKPYTVMSHFYPRSPRGERPTGVDTAAAFVVISIHAPREGSDLRRCLV